MVILAASVCLDPLAVRLFGVSHVNVFSILFIFATFVLPFRKSPIKRLTEPV